MKFPGPAQLACRTQPLVSVVLAVFLAGLLPATDVLAESVSLTPSKDTTIYGDGSANLSSGAGAYLFAGISGERRVLRSLVAFDIAGRIPAGSTINSVRLTFAINTPLNHAATVRLHRVSADWGEGSSIAPMGGAGGAIATNGDATWNHRFFNTAAWTTPGGDFSSTVSASQPISGRSGTATFSSAGLTADVQAWVNTPASNFGWILVAENEASLAVRFASRQGAPAPTLVVDYTTGPANTAPAITAQPSSQTVTAGAAVTFTVAASGTPSPSFQWRKNGVAIAGATSSTLTLNSVAAADAGSYSVVATNAAGSATSASATLTVTAVGGNTAPAIIAQPASQSVSTGAAVTFSVTASGTPAPSYQWRKDGVAIAGATSSTLTLNSVAAADAGSYSVVVTNAAGSVTSTSATLTVMAAGSTTARLSNLSVRAAMAADQTLIVGFSVRGGSRPILVRGVGPTLRAFEVPGTMDDPRLELYNGSTLVMQNDNWDDSVRSAAFGFPLVPNSRDAAFLPLIDGTRTVHLQGTGGGVVLVELYDAGSGSSSRLVNVSARNRVGTGDNILIFGFVIDGAGTKNVLIRAIGPRLGEPPFGVPDVLGDPRLDVFRAGASAAFAGNDNWDVSLSAAFNAVNAFNLTTGSRDAALVTSLAAGEYTVQVSGVNNATGEALVEIYELP